MISIPTLRWQPPPGLSTVSLAVSLFASLLFSGGCADRAPRAYPWATAIAVRPKVPVLAPGYKPAADIPAAPDLAWDFPPPPSKLAIAKSPARPRVYVAPSAESAPAEKADSFSLAPQLSEQEIAAARRQLETSFSVVQKNLAAAKGRQLNPTQTDLASKVRSFIDEANGAAREGDWNRAKNLAKKAEVLSQELADSL